MEKLTSRQQQAIQSKKQIYEVSMELFEKYGFEKVTIKQICSACNISTGGFYHYFKGKEDILVDKYRMTDSTFYGDVTDLPGDSYIDKIVEYMGKYARKAEEDGPVAVTEICHAWLSHRLGFPYDDNSEVIRGLSYLLKGACTAGEIPTSTNIKDFQMDIMMIVRGIIYHWCLMQGGFSVSEKTKETLGIYLNGKKN